MQTATAVLAARGSAWGGMVVGIVAAAVFVAFSAWIFVQRLRGHGQPPGNAGNGEDRLDD